MVALRNRGARAAAGALLRALLCALLCALPACAQWDMEGRAQVVGLSDMKAMKALRLLGRDMAPFVAAVEAAGASGAPRAGQPWCNLTSYGHGKSRLQLCAPTPPAQQCRPAPPSACASCNHRQRAQRPSAQHGRVPATRFVESRQWRAHALLVSCQCPARRARVASPLGSIIQETQCVCFDFPVPATSPMHPHARTPPAVPAGYDGPGASAAKPPQPRPTPGLRSRRARGGAAGRARVVAGGDARARAGATWRRTRQRRASRTGRPARRCRWASGAALARRPTWRAGMAAALGLWTRWCGGGRRSRRRRAWTSCSCPSCRPRRASTTGGAWCGHSPVRRHLPAGGCPVAAWAALLLRQRSPAHWAAPCAGAPSLSNRVQADYGGDGLR